MRTYSITARLRCPHATIKFVTLLCQLRGLADRRGGRAAADCPPSPRGGDFHGVSVQSASCCSVASAANAAITARSISWHNLWLAAMELN